MVQSSHRFGLLLRPQICLNPVWLSGLRSPASLALSGRQFVLARRHYMHEELHYPPRPECFPTISWLPKFCPLFSSDLDCLTFFCALSHKLPWYHSLLGKSTGANEWLPQCSSICIFHSPPAAINNMVSRFSYSKNKPNLRVKRAWVETPGAWISFFVSGVVMRKIICKFYVRIIVIVDFRYLYEWQFRSSWNLHKTLIGL